MRCDETLQVDVTFLNYHKHAYSDGLRYQKFPSLLIFLLVYGDHITEKDSRFSEPENNKEYARKVIKKLFIDIQVYSENMFNHSVIPENIHTSPTEGIFSKTPHPSGNSN